MGKTMYELRVYVDDDGDIHMDQPYPGTGIQQITISPGQVDLLVEWLKEAKFKPDNMRICEGDNADA